MIDENIEQKLQERYNQKKQEDESNESGFDFSTDEERLVMPIGFTVCRVVDMPVECHSSFIKCDDGKTRLFKFPAKEVDPSFILYKVIDKVIYQVWKGTTQEGKPIIDVPVKTSNPDIYNMVYNNGDSVIGKYGANGWGAWKKYKGKRTGTASTTSCYLNVINRQEFEVKKTRKEGDQTIETVVHYGKDWCVKNKHSLLLAKAPRSVGAPITIANLLMSDIFPNYGNFVKYDVAIHRTAADPFYKLVKADTITANKEVFPFVQAGDLTAEEKNIELYNTEEMVKPSTSSFVYQHLKDKITMVDKAMGTHFIEELEAAVQKETGAAVKKEAPITPKREVASTPKVRTPIVNTPVDNMVSIKKLAAVVEGKSVLDLLKPEETAFVQGISPDGELFIFTDTDLLACPSCNKGQPSGIGSYCVYCGVKY